jgi:hypothetical protein
MKQNISVRIPHSLDNAPRHLLSRQIEMGMHSNAYDIELRQNLIADVEIAVLVDVHLSPLQDDKAYATFSYARGLKCSTRISR